MGYGSSDLSRIRQGAELVSRELPTPTAEELENTSIIAVQKELQKFQESQMKQQMYLTTATTVNNSWMQHDQSMFAQDLETLRTIGNDSLKRTKEAQIDTATVLKETAQMLAQASAA